MRQMNDTGGAGVAPPDVQSPDVQSLEHRIRALAELTIGELKQAWTEAWNAPPPKGARRRLMMLGIAWKWQAEVHGGFGKPLERRLATLEAAFRQGGAPKLEGSGASRPPRLQPGARLIRIWKGERHEVQVSADRLSLARPRLALALRHRPRDHRQPPQRPGLLRSRATGCAVTRSAAARKPVRCAIYTRKSTAEGLEQAFNSLDAQREACTAYVLSQKHEGWTALPHRYDDGGFSGGAMDRPALHRLLEDVRAGRVDAVLVYKVDRLTRALADFARIVAIFEAAQVAFVSVTQAFDTRSPMGKLTLNVLLSFSQFERELAAERIRDKIAASKARGLWMGGMVPIGYRAEARTLTPVPDEAALVRRIFERYLALGSVRRLKAELDAAGIRTPERLHRNGRRSGGAAFSRGKLYGMLANPVFIGRIRHRDLVHPGQHARIVDPGLWQAVQDRLAANRVSRSLRQAARAPSPLAGRLLDPEGRKMRPSHAEQWPLSLA